jgi:predicted phosphatase
MSAVAKDAGLSRENLYKALSSEGHPEFSTVMKVLGSLGVYAPLCGPQRSTLQRARKEGDKLACEAWNNRMLAFQALPSLSPVML